MIRLTSIGLMLIMLAAGCQTSSRARVCPHCQSSGANHHAIHLQPCPQNGSKSKGNQETPDHSDAAPQVDPGDSYNPPPLPGSAPTGDAPTDLPQG